MKRILYFVVSAVFTVGALLLTGNTTKAVTEKAVTEKVWKESNQQLVLQQAYDMSNALAWHSSHSSHSSHRSHSSHSSHSSHYSGWV